MAEQYVIVYFADADQVAEAVGPFRSEGRARDAAERMDQAADAAFDSGALAHSRPQLVRLRTLELLLGHALILSLPETSRPIWSPRPGLNW